MKFLLRIHAILTKELRYLRRDRMTFGMVVMIPFIQLMLFGYAINTNIHNIFRQWLGRRMTVRDAEILMTGTHVVRLIHEKKDIRGGHRTASP